MTDNGENMDLNCEELWKTVKKDMPINQVMQTENLFGLAESREICCICGDKEKLFLGKVKTDKGKIMSGIFCTDCMHIQKSMGTHFIEERQLK